MRSRIALAFALLAAGTACAPEASEENQTTVAAAGQDTTAVAPQHSPSGDLQFASVLDLNQAGSGVSPQLRHGEVARSADWPASLYATFNTPGGRAVCTAALVGPASLLTAGHCVPTSGTVSFVLAGNSYTAECERHPAFADASDPSADYALCKVGRPVAAPPGFKYETISVAPMNSLVNAGPIILGGYGCISDVASEGTIDGRYRIGSNSIEESSDSPTRRRRDPYYSPQQRNNLITTDDPDLANLCPGDSGGPAFRATGTGLAQRRIIGINSRVFYLDATRRSYASSLISATGGPSFRPWAEAWATRNQAVLCGVSGSMPNCR